MCPLWAQSVPTTEGRGWHTLLAHSGGPLSEEKVDAGARGRSGTHKTVLRRWLWRRGRSELAIRASPAGPHLDHLLGGSEMVEMVEMGNRGAAVAARLALGAAPPALPGAQECQSWGVGLASLVGILGRPPEGLKPSGGGLAPERRYWPRRSLWVKPIGTQLTHNEGMAPERPSCPIRPLCGIPKGGRLPHNGEWLRRSAEATTRSTATVRWTTCSSASRSRRGGVEH